MIISLLYLISAILSLSLGLFSFFNNPKGKIQKIFLILSIDIFLWAFDYCLINLSIDVKLLSFVFIFFIGTITDIIIPIIGKYPLPPMSIIYFIIPLFAFYRAITKFNLMELHLDSSALYFLKSTKTGAIILNNNMNITEISEGALSLLGDDEENIKEKQISEIFPYFKNNITNDFNNLQSYAIKGN